VKPTYEQLEAELAETKIRLSAAEAKLKKTEGLLKLALERIAKLEEQLNRTSKNSSKPPSTDQKANTSDKKRKKRKSRMGRSRTPYSPERVDHRVCCKRKCCPHCNSSKLQELSEAPFSWQQVELPEIKAIVTQFDCLKYQCKECDRRSMGSLPENTPFSAFGPKLMAFVACLTGRFHLSKREAITLIKDLYDIDLSEGSVINVEENVSNALGEIYEKIYRYVIEGDLCRYFDETSWRNSGKRHYAWIGTTKSAAYYRIDPHRSTEALFKMIGQFTDRPAVTDRYSAYNALDGPRQYCLAHLIRDFQGYSEREGEDGRIGKRIADELRVICSTHTKWGEEKMSKSQYSSRLRYAKDRLSEYLIDGLALGSDDLSGLCERLSDEFEHLWTFRSIEGMDPTNNLAERDLRKLVLWRKKSYGTRSERGQKFVERVTSVVETLKKNQRRPLRFLEEAIIAFYRKQPAPSIAPSLGI
jgi:transposase